MALVLVGAAGVLVGRWGGRAQSPVAAPAVAAQPRVIFEPREVDLGRLPWFTRNPFTLRLTNPTSEVVRLAAIKPACGCTLVDISSYVGRAVPSGGAVEIAGTLEVGNALGERAREIEVMTDAGMVLNAVVKYTAYATYFVSPESANLGPLNLDTDEDEPSGIATLVFSSGTAKITEAPVADVPWLQVALDEPVGERQNIVVRALKTELTSGHGYGRVTIRTSDPTRPEYVFAVQVDATSTLRALSERVFLRPGEAFIVRFADRAGRDAKLVEAVPSADFLEVSIIKDGRELRIAALPGDSRPRSAIVQVSDDQGRKTRVRVSILGG
ncbi:MAG: hypothetical protein U1D55_07925 [Phycisphaerae bacterium]